MAKGSRRLALGMMLLPLVYAAVLLLNLSPMHLGKLQLLLRGPGSLSIRSDDSGAGGMERARMVMRRLVRGSGRRELSLNRVACVTSDRESDFCVTSDSVRIVTGTSRSAAVYLTAGQKLPDGAATFTLQPYPRKTDSMAMARTAPVRIFSDAGAPTAPPCDVVHSNPAVVFSTGGFAGNFFHDVNDVLIPLFLVASRLGGSRLVVTDYEYYWVTKYRRVLAHLAGSAAAAADLVVASSPSLPVQPKVHCFPGAVIGLKYHNNLACNGSAPPGGITIHHFRHFLREALDLPSATPVGPARPLLVFLSRKKSRALLNEDEVIKTAQEVGFTVEVVKPETMKEVEASGRLVASAAVLAGVHGAGMTNMVFLSRGSVLLQVVPWGLDWAAAAYYGRPAVAMGLEYVEYRITVMESTLSEEYPPEHPVLSDPWSINLQGYNVSRPVYTDGQNVRLDLDRFRGTLTEAMHRARRRPSSEEGILRW